MQPLQKFSWDLVKGAFTDLGYDIEIDSDGDFLARHGGAKLNCIVKPVKDDVTDEVRAISIFTYFGVKKELHSTPDLARVVLGGLNQISSFCSFFLSNDDTKLIIQSYLPVLHGLHPGQIKQIVNERNQVVLETGSKIMTILVD